MIENNYVSPKQLKLELIEYKKTHVISDKLGQMILDIATRYASKPNFNGYTYKEDFVADAILRVIEQLDKIDLDHPKSNPFAYLTKICHWKFVAKINYEKRYTNTKERYQAEKYEDFAREENISLTKNVSQQNDELLG